MRHNAPLHSNTIRLGRLLRGASATAFAVALAAPAIAQAGDQQQPPADANRSSPTGNRAGPGTAGASPATGSPTGSPGAPASGETATGGIQTTADAGGTSDTGENGRDDVVVTGIRQSLANAQNIKRNSDTVVDAITAQDIGALPDRSVTEALQRVPGVEISRFAGANDPDHFSVEGSGVTVRGLNFVRSEFNGRDAFSAGIGGQALNFADVPSELLGSVQVYKNVTAAAIEGGLAGTVNLNTRKPFDNKGPHIGVDLEANYGDFEKKWSPTGSILFSDTFDTPVGTFGILGDVSYSRIRSRADGIQVTNFQARDNTQVPFQSGQGVLVCRIPLPSSTDTTSFPPNSPAIPGVNSGNPVPPACGAAQVAGANGFADPLATAYAPLGGQFRSQDFDRKRDGIALAAQFESADRKFLLTGQFLRSHSSNSWGEHTFESAPDLSEYNTFPLGCRQNSNGPLYNGNATTRAECRLNSNGQFSFAANDLGNGVPLGANSYPNYVYDSNGLFQSGYITQPGTGFRSNRSGSPATTFIPTGGQPQSLSRRQVFESNTVSDYGLNAKINPDDHWSIDLDGDYTRSEHDVLDFSTFGETFADQQLDITGNLPVLIPHKPATLAASWAGAPNPALVSETDAQYFADPNVQFWRAAMDHVEHSRGEEWQFNGNFSYKFEDDSFIQRVSFGARYADRDQNINYSTYNWGMISEVWAGYPVSIQQQGKAQTDFYTFPDFFRGATPGPVGGYYYNGDLINGYSNAVGFLQGIESTARTANGNTQQQWLPASQRVGAIAGTPFLPTEVSRIHQRDSSAYVMLPFKSDTMLGGVRLSGNVGVRYVNTGIDSFSSTSIPTLQSLGISVQGNPTVAAPYDNVLNPDGTVAIAGRCALRAPPAGAPAGTPSTRPGGVCNLGPDGYAQLVRFAATTPTFIPTHAFNNYHYFLPSFNLKLGVTQTLQVRLAASKVLTRPDTSLIRPYQTIGTDSNGNFQSTVGNPYLKPATAWQFDVTAEWYFSKVGSLTADIFYKDVKNFFYSSLVNSTIINNGVSFSQLTRGPANYKGDGKIKGAEIAYQQTFDFLPWIFSGLGFSGNYSYIDSSGLPNAFLNGGVAVTNVASVTNTGRLPLEGLSKHNFNATVFYEKGPVSLRAAYNWRSKFLLTAADVIFPYTSIFQDAGGQLDASGFINLNKYFKIGVQGVNLTNQVTKTLQAYSGDPGRLAPRSYFMNDRRFSFILRGNF